MMTGTLAAVYLLAAAPAAEPARYARPAMLVEAEHLAKATPHQFRVLDIRPKEKYDAGHVPGAVHAPVERWSKAVAAGTADAAFWKAELAAVGVRPDPPAVVVYDDAREGARAWWLLTYAGVPDVRLLNGGWAAYTAARLPVTKEPTLASVDPHDWVPLPDRQATKDDLLDLVKAGGAKALVADARSAEEHTGAKKLAARGGHVPGAAHLEWSDLLDPATQKFKPPAELAKLFAARGIDLAKPCVTYCQSGGRASVVAFGLQLMGARDVKNYYRSWSEWGNAADTPVEKR